MTEIFIQKSNDKREIALVEEDKLIEYYEENENSNRNEGNIYIGIVRDIIKGMEAAFVDIGTNKNSFIHLKDILPKVDETKTHEEQKLEITDVIKPKQKILVQVKKDSNSKKGARVSTHINLPSKYIVLMPNTDIITVSQKIEDKKEQQRLIKLVKNNLSEGNGAIIRTLAEGKEQEIIDDIKKIEKVWRNITQTSIDPEENKAKLLYKSKDILEKILMDLMDENISRIVVNSQAEKSRIEKILNENKEYKNIKVKNIDNKKIYFGLGGHPAFKCEYITGKYEVAFEEKEDKIEFLKLKNGLVDTEKASNILENNKIHLTENIFDNDLLILHQTIMSIGFSLNNNMNGISFFRIFWN